MISQHWFIKWLCAVKEQAITWTNVHHVVSRHMTPQGPNELMPDICLSVKWTTKHHDVNKWRKAILSTSYHDGVIKWKHFPRYWPFVRGIHRSPVNSPYKGQWHGALMFSLICAWINGWVNNREASDLRRHRAHYDVNVYLWNGLKCFT